MLVARTVFSSSELILKSSDGQAYDITVQNYRILFSVSTVLNLRLFRMC